MENYPTYLFKRFIDNDEQTYNAVIMVKKDTIKNIPEEKERIIFMEAYLGELFTSLTKPAHSMPFIYDDIIRNITQVIEKTPFYILHCLPNKEAAVICNKTISRT